MHSAIIVSNLISFISERKNVATKQSFFVVQNTIYKATKTLGYCISERTFTDE